MWQCAQCKKPLPRPRKWCGRGTHPTGIAAHLVVAAKDRPRLLARVRALKTGTPLDWQRLSRLKRRLRKRIGVSINMHPEYLTMLLMNPRVAYVNLHDRIAARMLPEYDEAELAVREQVDDQLFGPIGRSLLYGALNLGNRGLISYGAACVFLKPDAIRNRVTFLESNSYDFRTRAVPPGSRALWNDAADLAMVKHRTDLLSRGRWYDKPLQNLLLQSDGNRDTEVFIEAQILDPIQRRDFDHILYDSTVPRRVPQDDVTFRMLSDAERAQWEEVIRMSANDIRITGVPGIPAGGARR